MRKDKRVRLGHQLVRISAVGLVSALLLLVNPQHSAKAGSDQASFGSPEEAVSALLDNLKSRNVDGLARIFGQEDWDTLVGPDKIQAREGLEDIYEAAQVAKKLIPGKDGEVTLIVGSQAWPFPIPIVSEGDRWHFDTAAGLVEVLSRRIGKNELSAIGVLHEYVSAQIRYAGVDHDGDEVLEYAQRISSSPGKQDGLYWTSDTGSDESPLGAFVTESVSYLEGHQSGDPFKGYYFKVLTRQGDSAPGGRYDYVINGNMIGGFAMLAYPAEYANSGIVTFIVNQQGKVFELDLGEETGAISAAIDEYDPKGWTETQD